MDDPEVGDLPKAVTDKLTAYADRLPQPTSITRESDGDLRLTIDGNRPAAVVMHGGTEVFVLELSTHYFTVQTAYDDETKLETVDDLLETLDVYLQGNYYEKVYESAAGEELHRDLYLDNAHFGGSHGFPRAQLRRLRAKHTRTITP
ncbi:hypothetical protein E1263_22815 [Kribbella antibiotica]|uniref:Uncharacterized protein n=1 Tax=Kribbella antibiotica TaxID=190195 RepID=A0A4R4ZGR7_9ACTN|nr:hypothetical protein [Kribbella antibiotica]TDD57595.1 hypothetical protein E1263_22815 [Kribbella antibiotica]